MPTNVPQLKNRAGYAHKLKYEDKIMSTENTINEASNPACFLGAVGSSTVLKKYKSCANCRCYEFAGYKKENWCTLGFPLEKLIVPINIRNRQQNDVDSWEHKPKYGCLQKQYYGSKKIDWSEASKVAQSLW